MNPDPIWRTSEYRPESSLDLCAQGDHVWVAFFLKSGRLAYWQCEICGLADRKTDPLPERLEDISGWIEFPPRLTARGPHPPASLRRWTTAQSTILSEADPSSIHHVGLLIPELTEAHTYVEREKSGAIRAVYEPSRDRHSPYGDHYTLTRYQVIDDELVQFKSHCFEESTLDVPSTSKPQRRVVLAGLSLLLT